MAATFLVVLSACLLLHGGDATLGSNDLRQQGTPGSTRSTYISPSPWTWRCSGAPDFLCRRHALEAKEVPSAIDTCKLTCGPGANLWPQPQHVVVSHPHARAVNFNAMSIEFLDAEGTSIDSQRAAAGLLEKMTDRFRELQEGKGTCSDGSVTVKDGGKAIDVQTYIKRPEVVRITLDTDESYELRVVWEEASVKVNIVANNVFGVRHGLETLNQLIVKDDLRREVVLLAGVEIRDAPSYKYRGVLLDTARSYVSIEAIKRTLDAMAASKLNTFHWHITDSQSFPFVSKTFPDLARFGAFSTWEIYTPEDIADVVEYARVRGVRVLPEFDAPAHVGEGWQSVKDATVCFRKEPWQEYCVEPPCGQLDPTVDRVYDVLAGIYRNMLDAFRPDMFHMGGDEVNFNCWNTTESIVKWMSRNGSPGRGEDDFRLLWNHFQSRALQKLVEANKGEELPVVLWTSGLTAPGEVDRYLDPKKYIIQIWTLGNNTLIGELSQKKFQLIFSNYDALYLDCGFGAWVGEGNNWCSPYIGWQKVYDNDPRGLLRLQNVTDPALLANVLGAEAALWTEQADSSSVDGRLWPRAAAMAERLWTARDDWTWRDAEHRLLDQRNRLVQLGVQADRVEPQWCDQNPGLCNKKPED